ncbi:nucleotidyltransferase domain-containing protein, partial [Acinetobacter baumannii]
RVKPLLYVFRVLLTGIHLMRTGAIEANLAVLNEHYPEFKLTYIPELIARKTSSREQETLDASEVEFYDNEYYRLLKGL